MKDRRERVTSKFGEEMAEHFIRFFSLMGGILILAVVVRVAIWIITF